MTVYGIDFGTCYSCIAVAESGNTPKVIPTSQGENTLPSVVEFRLRKGGIPRVGSTAKNAITPRSRNVAAFLKTEMDSEKSAREYEVSTGIFRKISPIEFAACVFKQLYRQAQEHREADCRETSPMAVITVPAVCSEIQREKTKVAAEKAGLQVMKIINEPTAAAISYNISEGETIMVFDLGGGTHDVSIVQRLNGDNYQVVVSKGDDSLGGKNWDEKLIEIVFAKSGLPYSENVLTHKRMIEFEQHKINLCSEDEIDFPFNDDNGVQHEVTVGLEEFEQYTEDLVDRAVEVARNAAEAAMRINPNIAIKRICMSGGACRMSAVRRGLQQAFPKIPVSLNNPDMAIALGAATYALSLAEQGEGHYDIHVTERGHAYGFKTVHGENHTPMIENFINVTDPLEIVSRKIVRYMSVTGRKHRLTVYENSDDRSSFKWNGEKPFFNEDIEFDHSRSVGSRLEIQFERDANGLVNISVNADGHDYNFSFATKAGSISESILKDTEALMLLMEQNN